VFVGVGVFVTLFGLRLIEPGGRLNVPHWVLIPIGLVFGGAGLFIWSMIWRQHTAARRRDQLLLRHPGEPAPSEYDGDPAGSRSRLGAHAVRATLVAVLFVLFLTPFNYISFQKDGHLMMQALTGLFNVVTLCLIYAAALCWGRAWKFGPAFLRYDRFPLRTDQPVRLMWIAPPGCRGAVTGRFTLRCVIEWYESSGRGKSRDTRLVHEQQWSGIWELAAPALIAPGMTCELQAVLPPGCPGTSLHSQRPVFWELEVDLHLPGLDFKETHLVPLYARPRS
jgi:hypothetical protein